MPLCILPDGSRLASATVEQVAAGLGMVAAPSRSEYDLTIVGAGPAGLAARDLGASMSQYLIDHLSAIPNVDVRVRTQVVGLEADDRLRALVVRSGDGSEPVPVPADALFICIGGLPRTDSAAGIGLATNPAGYLVTGGDGAGGSGRQLAAAQGAAAAGDQPARSVRRRRRAQRVGQTLRRGHWRGINGRGAHPPAAGGARR